MPSMGFADFDYAALLYKDGEIPANPESKDFVQGTETEDGKLIFSFQRPDDTSGKFTLELFAFVKTEGEADEDAMQFSRESALLSGKEAGLEIVGDKIVIEKAIPLLSDKPGTVSLKIKVPEGCSLEIDDTANFDCKKDDSASDAYMIVEKNGASGIATGAYSVTFTVKKDEEIIYIFSEYINVINGLCTNTWWNGDVSSEVKDVSQSMSKTVYVRGSGAGWYDVSDYKNTATASDENSGSFLAPLATIQKAIDKIIAINDGASAYTIYLDGTFTATSSAALADFNAFSQTQKLSVKIAGFSASQKAVLDGGDMACGIVAGKPLDSSAEQKNMNLTLENLVIQNAKNPGSTVIRGGAIMLCCKADNLHTIKNCEIKNNRAAYGSAIYNEYGSLNLQGCVISGNKSSENGAVYIGEGAILTTSSDVRIENNSYVNTQYGGGVYVGKNSEFIMNGSTISDNTATYGGGGVNVAAGGTFTMNGGTISGNTAKNGGGVCISADISGMGTFNMNGAASIPAGDDGKNDVYLNASGTNIATICIAGVLTATTPVATITPSAYTEGMQVISLASGSGTTLAANCGKFELSQAGWKIDDEGKLALSPDIYVSEGGDDTSGKGSQAKPFATLQKAFDLIQTLNLSTVSYIVHISGTVKGKSELSADVSAQKISITGTTDAKLAGDTSSSSYLIVSCSAPVEITNVTLTNNRASAIYVKSGANVTLGKGAAVFNNNFTVGGVDIASGGTFTMKSGATISENKNRTAGGGGGGGVRNKGTFIMEGGTISGNYVSLDKEHGGGVYSSGTFIMKDGEISGNYTSTTYSNGNGGGVYIAGGTFEMTGGTISGNRASSAGAGGGVYVGSGCTFTMSGAAKIAEDNDVYLANHSVIRIADDLTAQSPVATITHYTYAEKSSVISLASGGTMTQDICDKFAITPQDDGTEWKIVPDGANGVLKTTSVYVRGSDATWYENNNPTATASDTNAGTRSKPLATIQKAVEKIIDMNDGADAYTIFIDGTLDGTTDGAYLGDNGMADFSTLDKNLTLTIKALSETAKATLDGGARFDASGNATNEGIGKRIINAKPASGALNLTLENLVIKGGYTTANGGGIYFDPASDTLTMNKCEISGNISTHTLGGGGGIYNKGTLTMKDCTISENKVQWYGGGVYNYGTLTITGGTISDNTTWRSGGGIYNYGGTATITGCTIKSCKVEERGVGDYRYGGAGIYITGGGSLTAEGCEITENTVTSGIAVYGAGVYVYEGTFIMEDGTKISKNRADWEGGGVYVVYSGSTFIMNGGEISGNHGVLRGDELSAEYKASVGGGGVYISRGGAFTMNHGSITGNTSGTVGGGVYVSNYSYGAGTFTMKGGAISGNTASEDGGGVYVYQEPSSYTAMFTMEDGTISGNTAGGDGGGVALKGGMFILESGTISINKAVYGAGIHVSGGGTFAMENGTISGNIADGKNDSGGGGIHLFNGTVEMSGGEIIENHAKGTAEGAGGGGIYIYHSNVNTFTMTGTAKISNNDAVRHGGGVYQGAGSNFTSNIMGNISGNNPDEVYNEP